MVYDIRLTGSLFLTARWKTLWQLCLLLIKSYAKTMLIFGIMLQLISHLDFLSFRVIFIPGHQKLLLYCVHNDLKSLGFNYKKETKNLTWGARVGF